MTVAGVTAQQPPDQPHLFAPDVVKIAGKDCFGHPATVLMDGQDPTGKPPS